jgi:hypothetical protein
MNEMLTRTFPLTGAINLSVRVGRGSLFVETADDLATATVCLSPSRGAEDLADQFTVEMVGPTLTVAAPPEARRAGIVSRWRERQRSREGVAVSITVPTGTALKIETSGAPITVTGRCGGADVATGSCAIVLGHVDGDLLLSYGSAVSRVDRVSGSATVRCGSGEAVFGIIEGSLERASGSGPLDVAEVHGTVRSRSGSGSSRLAAVHGDVDLASGSGAMSIGLPAGIAAHVNATTGSGRVRSELPIEERPTPATKTPITVRARTGSGDIHLFRAGSPECQKGRG